MQNLHFFCQALVFFAKTGRFRCIRLLPPLGFSRAERFDLKPPGLQLRAGDTRLPGNAALCRARFIKPLNRCCLILVRILPSMVSRLVPLSWTGIKYPTVRKQGRSSCATPGFIRTDVGMPVADHRIDMCRTGPPCNATAGKAGNDTMDSPALHSDLTGALVPAFPVRKTGTAVRFSLWFYAGMVRRPQVRSTQEHSIQEQESGRKLRACTLPQIRPQTGSCTRAIFPLFFP